MKRSDRQCGTLISLAIGDAPGAAIEFEMPDTFLDITSYRGDGPYGLSLRNSTDDTSMCAPPG
jgi:ADP-ribosyl-[dinitrogen reductase] hydrolase